MMQDVTAGSVRPHFRFEDLEIWRLAKDIAVLMHGIAERVEGRKLYRYAEQLRAAGLSISNNIAEGAGSVHAAEFKQYLNIARRSLFEVVSMILIFEELKVIIPNESNTIIVQCDRLSRMITSFSRTR